MLMICQGPTCGLVFEARRRTAKFCHTRCSVAASRAGAQTEPTPAPPGAVAGEQAGAGRSNRGMPAPPRESLKFEPQVYETTLAELEAAGRVRTSAGQVALWLAARIDAGSAETGSAAAALAEKHAAAVTRALAAGSEDDPVAKIQNEAAEIGKLRSVPTGG